MLFRKQQKHGHLFIKQNKQKIKVLLSGVTNTDLPIMNSYERSIGDWTSACFATVIYHPFHCVSQRLLFWCTFTQNRIKCFLQIPVFPSTLLQGLKPPSENKASIYFHHTALAEHGRNVHISAEQQVACISPLPLKPGVFTDI